MSARRPLALFGRETLYVGRLYATQILLVTSLVLALVLALDLAGHADRVLAAQGVADLPDGAQRLFYYLALRAGYNLPAILPVALPVGIIWTEFRLVRLHEREMIAITGRAPALSLIPALLVGLAAGLVQNVLVSDLRPQVVEEQAAAGFRSYGARFSAGTVPDQWLDLGDTLMRTTIRFDERGAFALSDIRLFQFDAGQRLERIVWADGARPGHDGLDLTGDRATWPPGAALPDRVPVEIDTLWLSWAGVDARFLPRPVLARIAGAAQGVPRQNAYRAALQERWASVGRSVAVALMVASLSLQILGRLRGLLAPLVIATLAYGLHIAANVMEVLGEYEVVGPILSAWLLPAAVLGATVTALIVQEWRVRRMLACL